MEVKEFRTGNLLNYTTAENDILPTRIDWQDLKWLEEDSKGFELAHSKISLTEDILVKIGFKIVNHIDGYRFYSFRYKGKGGMCNISIFPNYTRVGNNTSIVHLEYVHQLQNLLLPLIGLDLIFSEMVVSPV